MRIRGNEVVFIEIAKRGPADYVVTCEGGWQREMSTSLAVSKVAARDHRATHDAQDEEG